MTSEQVASILCRRHLSDTMNAYGFPLNDKFRLERGSGIAGRGNVWNITHIQTGEKWQGCETAKELRLQLTSFFKVPTFGVNRGRKPMRREPAGETEPRK